MAAMDKLHKALEALKLTYSSSSGSMDDGAPNNKEKISLAALVADTMCAADVRNAPNFNYLLSYSIETLLRLCDDQDSNIRMIADESLNRIIRVQMQSNVSKVNLELHKEIKRNGSARSLRAALWRFAELAHLIRPAKGRPYMQSLAPCIIKIAGRSEESVLETLATALPKILSSLGPFMTDNEAKQLINTFLKNVHSENAVLRRTAASSIVGICTHSSKSQWFIVHTITTLLELVLPIKEDQSIFTILGVLNCLRGLLPRVANDGRETFLRGSFGAKKKTNKRVALSTDSMIQVYELCLHWTHHSDHNVITAALETLNELLTSPPKQLLAAVTSPQGLNRSRIMSAPLKKLSSKALSEVSVATSTVDDSQLLDADDLLPAAKVSAWLDDSVSEMNMSLSQTPQLKSLPYGVPLDSLSVDYPDSESMASVDISLMLKEEPGPPSPDPDVLSGRDSPALPADATFIMDWDIGNPTEAGEVPLVYCARRLVTAFLVPESTSARVSIRALALLCLSQVLQLYPDVFLNQLDKRGQKTPQGFGRIYDVLRLSTHSDPQLRGLCRVVIGHFLHSLFHHGRHSFSEWFDSALKTTDEKFSFENLTSLLEKGLEDESSVTIRHTLSGLNSCIASIIESSDSSEAIPILEKLAELVDNPYWLIKAKLIELLSALPYQSIYFITGSSKFQDGVLTSIIPNLLSNEDSRVRTTTAESLVRMVDNLYFSDDFPEDDIIVARGSALSASVFSSIYMLSNGSGQVREVKPLDKKLSRVIDVLVRTLSFSTSKHLSHGCIKALSLLSVEFPPTAHRDGWSCVCDSVSPTEPLCSGGLFSLVVSLLTRSPVSLDLECHQWLLSLAGNLFNGLAFQYASSEKLDKKLLDDTETLLTHVMRILNMFVHITDESVYRRLPGMSPLRRKTIKSIPYGAKFSDDEVKEEKRKVLGIFSGNRHCIKVLDFLRAGYTNYKTTLDPAASEKLVKLITHVLMCMRELLLPLTVVEPGLVAEELLGYLSCTFAIDSTTTVSVVNQLMRSLFELQSSKVASEDPCESERGDLCLGLYANVLQKPFQQLSDHLEASHKPFDSKNFDVTTASKLSSAKSDRVELAKKIKLFEGIVIQALKEYTTTNNVKLQVEVLILLTQLVNLKVNYCLLDSEQVFIKFVKSQFEYIEAGQIHNVELLLPQIFKFLVDLSNEKNHTKPVISIPEIIQLCDGLMASGQNPVTHCIPALIPVVEHVFLESVTNIDLNELDTQREVVLAMLVRLAEFPQVLEILNQVMKDGWRWEDNWKRWYRQTVDTILPLLSEGKLLVNDINSLHSLLSLNSSFVAPLNHVLVLLFSHRQDGQNTVQWLGMVTTMLLSVCMYKEERVLLLLEEMNLYVREEGDDPLKVNTVSKNLPPQHLLAKLVVRVILLIGSKLKFYVENCCEPEKIQSLERTFANFLLCCVYLFQQGNYEEMSKSLAGIFKENGDMYTAHELFLAIRYRCPLITILWADVLVLLGQGEPSMWEPLVGSPRNSRRSLNLEVVRQGCIILHCEYLAKNQQDIRALSWLLDGHAEEVIWNCPELPVEKLLCSIYNLERNSKLLLDAAAKCVSHKEPIFTHRLLQTLENIHSNYTGSVLNLVALSLVQHRNIAIARLAAAFCSRTIEYMLTLEKTSVHGLLKKDELFHLLKSLKSNKTQYRRYSGLISVLKKLGEEVYGTTKWESEEDEKAVDVETIKKLKLDKSWLIEQIRSRCSLDAEPDGVRCTKLLATLGEDELDAMFLADNFDKTILQHCFNVSILIEVRQQSAGPMTIDSFPTVYKSARKVLLKYIHEICDALPNTYNVIKAGDVDKYDEHLQTLLSRLNLVHQLLPLAVAINNYLKAVIDSYDLLHDLSQFVPPQTQLDIVRFALLCIRGSTNLTKQKGQSCVGPHDLQILIESACRILSFDLLASHLKIEEIHLVLRSIWELVSFLTGKDVPLKTMSTETDPCPAKSKDLFLEVSILMASLLCCIEDPSSLIRHLPKRVISSLKALVVSFGRLPKLNQVCRLPMEVWHLPLDPETPPPIPIHVLHDPEILSQIVNRIQLLGWISRLQFEEIWVCLLSAITLNPDVENIDQEEISSIMHANSLVVEGITWLLISTLTINNTNSYKKKLLHVPRCGNHKLHLLPYWNRLEELNDLMYWKLQNSAPELRSSVLVADKRTNLERICNDESYGFGQLSVAVLQTMISPTDESPAKSKDLAHCESLARAGGDVDMRSCLQFVLDLYGQWVLPNSGISLNLQLSMVKSVVFLSDKFSEAGHYEWMFHTFIAMYKSHPPHDEVMHQYLIVGIAKSAAVLRHTNGENGDKVLKIIETAFKSGCPLIRAAAIHGALYLLQSAKAITRFEGLGEIPKSSPQEFRQRLLNSSYAFLDKHFSQDCASSGDCQLLIAMAMYLLEVFPEDAAPQANLMKTCLHLALQTSDKRIYVTVINGLERLILTSSSDSLKEQVTRVALERFAQSDPSITLPALQLLLSCIYSGKTKKEITTEESTNLPSDIEILEKTSVLFDKIKKGYPVEVEIVCEILPSVLSDFFPVLDVSTKVISEFLSPNQPHKKNMAAMVFQVFTQACNEKQLPLLQDWVVHCLSSFTNNSPLVAAVWSLCCFFISSSANPWLRAIFPHVQSRIRQCDHEDKEIFCIAAVQFYNQLNESQRQIFLKSFKETPCRTLSPFADVIACLS
ncbi:huntingtin [Nesidiocoris tenuis]|uniref:Huntingtin n=1 Tax=Nesidiocoris tenuis TaxID=355587 RepID=A0ABN7AWJ0_9HEMI|nr:huntingtin [Nesidiocoris tenuis]